MLFSPILMKIDITFESYHYIKSFKVILVVNNIAYQTKEILRPFYFHFLRNITDKNVYF